MPTIFSDPPQALYLILIAGVIVTGTLAARNQDRRSFIRLGIALGLLLVLFLVDRFFESPREEANRRVSAMAAAAMAANPDRFMENVSTSFEMRGANRERLKAAPAWGLIRNHRVRVAVWGFSPDTYEEINDKEIEVGFYLKVEVENPQGMAMWDSRARFVKDSDGQYRLKTVKFYNPAEGGLNAEVAIPGFP